MPEINKLTTQLESTQNRMKRARELYLDNELKKEEYQEMTTEFEVERQNLTTRLNHLQKDDKEFSKNISTIFEIASKSYEIFISSKQDKKRAILKLLFSNIILNGKNPDICLRKPFNLMVNLSEQPTWLHFGSKLRTKSYAGVVNFARRVKTMNFDIDRLCAAA